MKVNGSQMVVDVLLEQGVDTVFGYPGGTALNIFDALFLNNNRIKTVVTAHEQGASHAADGYARATGKTGVVIATSGPGATNLVTGIANAFMDSIPMVAITANVASPLIGRDTFQEICITGVTMPITKHNFFVKNIEDLAPALRDAFRIANSGRKGPVLVDITKDVTAAIAEYTPEPSRIIQKVGYESIPMEEIQEIAGIINAAEKPFIYIGGGVVASEAADELNKLMELADIPAAYTMMAAGVIGFDNPKNTGLLGMHGSVAANKAVNQADVMLALGTRFSDRVALNPKKFASQATKIQVDIDKSELNKNVQVDYSFATDVKAFLRQLLPYIENKKRDEWNKQITAMRREIVNDKPIENAIHPHDIIQTIGKLTDKETIYVTDVGQHQMWAAQFLQHEKTGKFITSGGLGTMGFGYGAAIGAQVGCPNDRIIHITGDGSFHMNLNEACTAVSNELPIITVIFNNTVLGMVYQWQTNFYDKRYSCTVLERKTDFPKLAEAFGAKGFSANNLDEFKKVFKAALKEKGPVWIDCAIDKEERVLPMIPGGGTVDDMIVG